MILLVKEVTDRHEKDIEELRKKLAAGTGGGGGVDISEMEKLFAGKNPPDNTLIRIEDLEKINADLLDKLMRHEKTLYQNSTLDDLRNQESQSSLRTSIAVAEAN